MKDKLSREYRWEVQVMKRRNRKGRTMGGMMIGIRKGIGVEAERADRETEGIMVTNIRVGEWSWRIVGVHINEDLEVKLEELEDGWKKLEVKIIVGGDFNARTGEEGGEDWEEREEEKRSRRSKDRKMNKDGKIITREDRRTGMDDFLMGIAEGMRKGSLRTRGQGSVSDRLRVGSAEAKEGVESLEMGNKIDLDHHPLITS